MLGENKGGNEDYQQFQADKEWMDFNAVTDLDTYLDMVENSLYLILVSVRDEATSALTKSNLKHLADLGLEQSLKNTYRASYLATVQNKTVLVEQFNEEAKIEETIEISGSKISLISASLFNGNVSTIEINGVDYSQNSRGLNLVLYDTQNQLQHLRLFRRKC